MKKKSQLDKFNPGPISEESMKAGIEDDKKADKAAMDRIMAKAKARKMASR